VAVSPFYVVVVDSDRMAFSVSGPSTDDTWETSRVCDRKREGHDVRCFTIPCGARDRDIAVSDLLSRGFAQVDGGLLV
jgi:hypothetical protein